MKLGEMNQAGGVPSQTQSALNRLRIPVPPLEIQREIVRVLDTFTQLEAELEAELEARRRQYAFYRDQLLSFNKGAVSMGELGSFFRGRRFTKLDQSPDGVPSIHYGEIYTDYGVSASESKRRVNSRLVDSLRFACKGDVIFAAVGETVEDVGKSVAWLGDEDVAIHDDTFAFRSTMNPKFVAYFTQTADFNRQKESLVSRAKVKRLSARGLASIRIPVPDLVRQGQIVAQLDKFDALVNNLTSGLPAEHAARRKQYEYYRDKLLTFDEAPA